jgi:hypothetical protein
MRPDPSTTRSAVFAPWTAFHFLFALGVERRRIVDLEEGRSLPYLVPAGIEDDLDRLGMAAVIAISRVRNIAAAVTNACRDDAGE